MPVKNAIGRLPDQSVDIAGGRAATTGAHHLRFPVGGQLIPAELFGASYTVRPVDPDGLSQFCVGVCCLGRGSQVVVVEPLIGLGAIPIDTVTWD